MAIDLIPRRFYSASSENSTRVSRLFVPNTMSNITSKETGCINETAVVSQTHPMSARSFRDKNNNTKKAGMSSRRKHRLTSDDFISEQNQSTNLNTSCEHLSEMTSAESDLELYGFCDPRVIKGLVPERFLPSLVTFKDKVPLLSRNAPNINQNSLTSPVSSPDINGLLRRFAGSLAGWKLQTTRESDRGTSVQTQECETKQRRENEISVCSNCGCYIWAKQTV